MFFAGGVDGDEGDELDVDFDEEAKAFKTCFADVGVDFADR